MGVILYYHCDEWKDKRSMSLVNVYKLTKGGKKDLLKQIQTDIANNAIEVEDIEKVKNLILNCTPWGIWDLNSNLAYGFLSVWTPLG